MFEECRQATTVQTFSNKKSSSHGNRRLGSILYSRMGECEKGRQSDPLVQYRPTETTRRRRPWCPSFQRSANDLSRTELYILRSRRKRMQRGRRMLWRLGNDARNFEEQREIWMLWGEQFCCSNEPRERDEGEIYI